MNLQDLASFKSFIFDVDGVFTDNRLLITENGELLRTMNARDGFAIKMLLQKGHHVAIITGGTSKGVEYRLSALGIPHIYSGIHDKLATLKKHLAEHNIDPNKTIYMGDDILDLECIKYVGLGCCPSDAAPEVINEADYRSTKKGGDGCVREIVEIVLKSQRNWIS